MANLQGSLGEDSAPHGHLAAHTPGEAIELRRDVLVSEMDQIIHSHTLERARYYLKRLQTGIETARTGPINDINLNRWKEYDYILTDSLWVMPNRDSSGAHIAEYWGNYIPQIPHQMMLRYTKRGEWALDPFAGSGTTLIECRRLGRNGIGIEINPSVVERAKELITSEPNPHHISTEMMVGDSRTFDFEAAMAQAGIAKVHLLMMHPPYHDIIRFSNDPNDLSNAETTADFLAMWGQVLDRVTPCLAENRFLALVIGDKYVQGEWIPLGFHCMSEVLKRGYTLRSIVVKNFEETRGKRRQQDLWRYRALAGGFYIFKHEYVMIFKKRTAVNPESETES